MEQATKLPEDSFLKVSDLVRGLSYRRSKLWPRQTLKRSSRKNVRKFLMWWCCTVTAVIFSIFNALSEIRCIWFFLFFAASYVERRWGFIWLNEFSFKGIRSHHVACLYLQRPCPLPGCSYFSVFETVLGVSLWAVVCSPQPIIARRVWGAQLYKNVATSYQVPTLYVAFTNSNKSYLLCL